MSAPTYFLAPHVFVCQSAGQVVLLDLKHDKYLALGGTHVRALGAFVNGWPASDTPISGGTTQSESHAQEAAKVMLERGLLTKDYRLGKQATPISIDGAMTTLCGEDMNGNLAVTLSHAIAFFSATAGASAHLRWHSLEKIVRYVRARKANHVAAGAGCSVASSQELVAIFERLRPLVFTSRNRCLFDSLALVGFLAHHGQFPNWVFGVRTHPFAAHCWVQEREVVFNDVPDHTRLYTPIMAI